MNYQDLTSGSQYPYPNHNLPPDKKNKDWCMQYAQAAYYDWSYSYPKGVFASNGGDYEKNRMYAIGKQPISQYKKMLGIDQENNNTWLSVDWNVRAVVSGYRDKAISRLMKEDYDIVATPVDMLAKSEEDMYYAKLKAKLAVRQLAQQQNPDLLGHPLLALQSNEPLDMEELEMRMQMGEQFNRSRDAELAIELAFYENAYKAWRRSIYEDLFDYGVAGSKDWLGDDNKAKFRRVNPENVIISYCKDATFSDLIHAGELISVSLVELATLTDAEGNRLFDDKELQEFAGSIAGKWGNPRQMGLGTGWLKPYDKFKCKVLDIEFYTYNDSVYMNKKDENGNTDFRKIMDTNRGKKSDKYIRKKIQYVYKCKWILGTDKCYDWGMAYDQKRSVDGKFKSKTKLSYTFCAYNFYEMKAQSFMERLIPYLDDYQLTIYKIQNFKNRAVPSGWWIDLDALESVALNKGGANMQPKELLQMFFETGVLVGRSKDEAGNPQSPNWKPVIPIENTAASELAMFYQDLVNTVMTIEKMTGYNDITSGNPNPKTLVPGYQLANESTNDALYPMAFAEETISLQLAENTLMRMQQGIKKSDISGYALALNSNTLRFISVNPDISLRDYGIRLEKKTTNDEKMWLLQQMQNDIANGFLDTSDAVMLVNTKNVKQAQMIWAYRVKKAKERLQAEKMAQIQAQNEGTQQAAMIAQQGAMQQKQMEYQFELEKENLRIQGEIEKERIRIESQERIALQNNQTKLMVANDTNDAKESASSIAAQGSIAKQQIANQKQSVDKSVKN